MTLDDMKAKLQSLRGQLTQLDVPGARHRAAIAKAKADELAKAVRSGTKPDIALQDQHQAAAIEAAAANSSVSRVEFNAGPLTREVSELTALVSSADRVAEAVELLATVRGMVASAQGGVVEATKAVERLDAMIVEESQAFDDARSSAAAKLLAAVKGGGDATKIQAASRDKVATFELAREAAGEELEAARAALKAAKLRETAVRRDLSVAKSDVAALEHAFALEAYTKVLANYMFAHGLAHGGTAPVADPRSAAMEIARAMAERLE